MKQTRKWPTLGNLRKLRKTNVPSYLLQMFWGDCVWIRFMVERGRHMNRRGDIDVIVKHVVGMHCQSAGRPLWLPSMFLARVSHSEKFEASYWSAYMEACMILAAHQS